MREPLLDTNFLERLERLTLNWRRSFAGLVGGHNPSRFPGSGQEFLDHRVFHHGDDLRAVNWRAFMRLEKLFLKMFQVEPRVPVRLMLDVSESMVTGGAPGETTKFQLARKIAAALCYIGLVRLDTITIQPFAAKLLDPFTCGGGRHRFQPAEEFLRNLQPTGHTDFTRSIRQLIEEYPQRGLLIILSDFLSDDDVLRSLKFLPDFGHELMLIQLWGSDDRVPSGQGELELIDAESQTKLHVGLNDEARTRYTANFDQYSNELRRLAQRYSGRYASLPASTSLDEAIFGSLVRSQGVA